MRTSTHSDAYDDACDMPAMRGNGRTNVTNEETTYGRTHLPHPDAHARIRRFRLSPADWRTRRRCPQCWGTTWGGADLAGVLFPCGVCSATGRLLRPRWAHRTVHTHQDRETP